MKGGVYRMLTVIPAHSVPAFKPAKTFLDAVKEGK